MSSSVDLPLPEGPSTAGASPARTSSDSLSSAAGPSSYLLLTSRISMIGVVTPFLPALRMVRAGDALLAPAITRRPVERFADRTGGGVAPHRDLATLTPREREVLHLPARGLSNAELAAAFGLSEATVKTHVARIPAKLRLRDRAQAVVVA